MKVIIFLILLSAIFCKKKESWLLVHEDLNTDTFEITGKKNDGWVFN